MIKAILFDLDDTLIKTYETKKEALKKLGKQYYGVELTDEVIREHWGKPIRNLFHSLFINLNDVEQAIDRYADIRKSFPTSTYEDTISTLNILAENYLLGIITSKSNRYLQDDFDLSGISRDLFFAVQAEEETVIHKPNPKVFNYILDKLKKKNIDKSEIIYIGDRLSDFHAAKDAGLHFYGILNETTTENEFLNQGSETINKISDLLGLL